VKRPFSKSRASKQQFAALCWRDGKAGTEVLLITSRETGRWVIPKGWRVKKKSASSSAAVEAWEEAGVTGQVSSRPVGHFTYDKVLNRDKPKPILQPCEVQVFALAVEDLADDFPEADQRKRRWMPIKDAADKVEEAGLRDLLQGFEPMAESAKRA
jgi:8-oxo-dGTP pyrophosphatase MutT (NUDIX family)